MLGHSERAIAQALEKKLMKPRFTPCTSLNLSLYCLRISIIGCMSTSLKVVSIAVVFLASTRRRLMVLRRLDILSARSLRLNNSAPSKALRPALAIAANTSSFTILPENPEGFIDLGSTFLSAIIAEATGVALTSGFLMAVSVSTFVSGLAAAGAGCAGLAAAGFPVVSLITAITSPIFKVS